MKPTTNGYFNCPATCDGCSDCEESGYHHLCCDCGYRGCADDGHCDLPLLVPTTRGRYVCGECAPMHAAEGTPVPVVDAPTKVMNVETSPGRVSLERHVQIMTGGVR